MKLMDPIVIYQGYLNKYIEEHSGNYLDFFKITYQLASAHIVYTKYLKVSKIDKDIMYQVIEDNGPYYKISCHKLAPDLSRDYFLALARNFRAERISADIYRENLRKIIEKISIDLQL